MIVVEHDEDTIRVADHVVDIGPGAGEHGGRIVAEGSLADVMAEPASITGEYLAGRRIDIPMLRRPPEPERGLDRGGGCVGEQPQGDSTSSSRSACSSP